MTTIVFLHVPKTAGQTVHGELVRLVGGPAHVSPVRVHTQAGPDAQMPPGYRLYSGHIDWVGIDSLPQDRFAFTVLRDPRERIASFYFYLRDQARQLSPADLALPCNLGKSRVLTLSADDYFFGGDAMWQTFIRDHYDNFYCSYFATRRMRGRRALDVLSPGDAVAAAAAGLAALQGVYDIGALDRLEADLALRFGTRPQLTGRFVNAGAGPRGEARWPSLLARFERDASARALARFCDLDDALMHRALACAA